jgi:hypothetical protein
MVEEISCEKAVQLIKPVRYESEDGEVNTRFELQSDVLDRLLKAEEMVFMIY